jgi:hypothetical protein
MQGSSMNYEEFKQFVRVQSMHETIYEDTENHEILIIRLVDAFVLYRKAAYEERKACAQLCDDSVEYSGSELARQIRARK